MDRLQTLGIFRAVSDSGSFAQAARQLGLSPPVVTRAVAELEAHLGVRLLVRTTRSVTPTDTGAAYAVEARRILAEVEAADARAMGHQVEAQGQLVLTAPALFGQRYITPIIAEYLALHPRVTVNALFLDRIVHLMDEGVDVAIRIGSLPDSALHATQVGTVARVLVASPAYLSLHGTPNPPEELAAHALIATPASGSNHEWRFGAKGDAVAIRINPRLMTTSNAAAVMAAVAGVGITRVISYQVAEELAHGSLIRLLIEHEPPPIPIHVVQREGRLGSAKVRSFVELASQRLREDSRLQWLTGGSP